jgi:phosphoglycerate dehydrogenase-like enzyme
MPTIAVHDEIAADVTDRVRALGLEVEILGVGADAPPDALAGIDAAVHWGEALSARRLLDVAPQLRWLHSWSAGVETLPFEELRQRNIALTNAAGVYAIPIAEWVLTAILMAVKHAHAMQNAQREHRWLEGAQLDELPGKTLLIVGTGGIGQEIAKRAAAFGMRIWGANRSGSHVEDVERILTGDDWKGVLPEADFVVVTLPATDETRNMIGADELRAFKRTAWLINVGRGATIDEPAMLQALRDGTLGGAAIDAWVREPLPPDHPAWTTPNLIIWPHHSGSSPGNNERGVDLLVENIRRFTAGEELLNIVDLEAGY